MIAKPGSKVTVNRNRFRLETYCQAHDAYYIFLFHIVTIHLNDLLFSFRTNATKRCDSKQVWWFHFKQSCDCRTLSYMHKAYNFCFWNTDDDLTLISHIQTLLLSHLKCNHSCEWCQHLNLLCVKFQRISIINLGVVTFPIASLSLDANQTFFFFSKYFT